MSKVRFMKVIVMFDLPTGNAKERKSYSLFHKSLVAEGYSMLQFSVYAKTCLGINECKTSIEHVKTFLPDAGSVTAFVMTEKQYENRSVLIAPLNQQAAFDPGEQLTLGF